MAEIQPVEPSKKEQELKSLQHPESGCLVETVAKVMAEHPAVEGLRVNRKDQSVAIATLGITQGSNLETEISEEIKHLRGNSDHACALLDGAKDCTHCNARLHGPQSSSLKMNVDHSPDITTITKVTCPTAPTFWRWRDLPLPTLVPRKPAIPEELHAPEEWKLQLAAAACCGLLGIVAYSQSPGPIQITLFVLAYIAGAWFAVEEVWEGLQRRVLDVHFLMLAVAVGSAFIGAWGEGTTLLFLFALSGGLEHFAMGRTQREIKALFKTAPKTATLIPETGIEQTIPTDIIRPGMRLRMKPGDLFPVDGEVITGTSAADESNLTGEAVPIEKSKGDTVLSGTLNLWGSIDIRALRSVEKSALHRIIELIQEAQHLKAPSQRFTDRFGVRYTWSILALSVLMFLWWWWGQELPPFVSTETAKSAFYRSMTLLVVASPCALVLSIPSAILAAIASGAKHGILFRGGAAVEKLAEINHVAMDKTGTLTTGELAIHSISSWPAGQEDAVLNWACSLEAHSTHPLARAITKHAKTVDAPFHDVKGLQSFTGRGLLGIVENTPIRLGKLDWVLAERPDLNAHYSLGQISQLRGTVDPSGQTATKPSSEVWVLAGDIVGRIELTDDIRSTASDVVLALHQNHMTTCVLTGDEEGRARSALQHLGVSEIRAGLSPEAKLEAIRTWTKEGKRVAMIGDGVNDAPSLAAAHVGVAMGARGSDAALEQAQVILMHDRLENFLVAWKLSQRAREIIRQNLVISLGVVAVLVIGAIGGIIPLTLGVLGHEGSTVIVVLNSLRLLLKTK